MGDLEQYARWLAESPAELIDYAAECARGMQMPMRYIDKLLASWRKSGVETVEAARAERANRAAAPGTRPSAAPNQMCIRDSHTTVGDNPARVKEALGQALDRADMVITTGGLGPTEDDLTKEMVGEYFGLKMVLHLSLIHI